MSDTTPPADEPQSSLPLPDAAPAPDAATPIEAAPAQWPAEGYPAVPEYTAPPAYPAAYPAEGSGAGYPPPAYPAYPPAPAAAPAGPQTSSNAIIALILAIVSWAVCPVIPAIVALVLAGSAAKEIAASGGRIQGAGLVTAARIVSWVNIGLWAAILVVGAFFLVLAVVAGGINDVNMG